MKIGFFSLLLIYGVVHLIGFTKAFESLEIGQIGQNTSKPFDILWLLVAILSLASAIQFLLKKSAWTILLVTSIVFSQLLAILHWNDAKFVTMANVLILVTGLPFYGSYLFEKMVQSEIAQLYQNLIPGHNATIQREDLKKLPDIVQKWLLNSKIVGRERMVTVHLLQKGRLRTRPKGSWVPFTAEQQFNAIDPSFVWTVKVGTKPMVYLSGRDKLLAGEGEMLIKLFSLFPIIREGKNEKINSGAMLRFLAETCWFPSAALEDYVTWENVDNTTAKAILTQGKKSVSGYFRFTDVGDLLSFETERFFGGGPDAQLEKWVIETISFKEFDGIRIPDHCKVCWKLEKGDFKWLDLRITALDFNGKVL